MTTRRDMLRKAISMEISYRKVEKIGAILKLKVNQVIRVEEMEEMSLREIKMDYSIIIGAKNHRSSFFHQKANHLHSFQVPYECNFP